MNEIEGLELSLPLSEGVFELLGKLLNEVDPLWLATEDSVSEGIGVELSGEDSDGNAEADDEEVNDSVMDELSLSDGEDVAVFVSEMDGLVESEGTTEELGEPEMLEVSLLERLKLLLSVEVSLTVMEAVAEGVSETDGDRVMLLVPETVNEFEDEGDTLIDEESV